MVIKENFSNYETKNIYALRLREKIPKTQFFKIFHILKSLKPLHTHFHKIYGPCGPGLFPACSQIRW